MWTTLIYAYINRSSGHCSTLCNNKFYYYKALYIHRSVSAAAAAVCSEMKKIVRTYHTRYVLRKPCFRTIPGPRYRSRRTAAAADTTTLLGILSRFWSFARTLTSGYLLYLTYVYQDRSFETMRVSSAAECVCVPIGRGKINSNIAIIIIFSSHKLLRWVLREINYSSWFMTIKRPARKYVILF